MTREAGEQSGPGTVCQDYSGEGPPKTSVHVLFLDEDHREVAGPFSWPAILDTGCAAALVLPGRDRPTNTGREVQLLNLSGASREAVLLLRPRRYVLFTGSVRGHHFGFRARIAVPGLASPLDNVTVFFDDSPGRQFALVGLPVLLHAGAFCLCRRHYRFLPLVAGHVCPLAQEMP